MNYGLITQLYKGKTINCPHSNAGGNVKRKIKVFLSLVYTVIFVVLASTGVLHTQAAELEFVPVGLNPVVEPILTEIQEFGN